MTQTQVALELKLNVSPIVCEVKEMERRCKSQQQQIFELKQELTNNAAELKLRLAQTEGNIHSDTRKWENVMFVCYTPNEIYHIYGISHTDRPSGNREAKVQTSSGGHGQSTPEGGTSFKIVKKKIGAEIRGKCTQQTNLLPPLKCSYEEN